MNKKKGEHHLLILLTSFLILTLSVGTALTQAENQPQSTNQPKLFGTWTFLGLEGKRVLSVAVTKHYLFAGAFDAGVYRKHLSDPTSPWEYLGFGTDQEVTELYINPLAPDVIYLGLNYPGGLYRSDNNGDTWNQLYPPLNDEGGSYKISEITGPKNAPETIIVTSRTTVVRSENKGETWTQLWRGQTYNINTIAIDPSDNARLWVGGETNMMGPFLIHSVNNGQTWIPCDLPYTGDNAVDSIAIHPKNSNIVYLGMEGKVMKTISGGLRWTMILQPLPFRYFYTLTIHPTKPNCIYAGGSASYPYVPLDLWKSSTNGLSWSHSLEENGVNIGAIEFDYTNYNILYIGSIGSGVWQFTEIPIQDVE